MGIESFDSKFEADTVLDGVISNVALLTHSEELNQEERVTMQNVYRDLGTIMTNLRDRKAEKGSINESGEFIRGRDISKVKMEEELPNHLL